MPRVFRCLSDSRTFLWPLLILFLDPTNARSNYGHETAYAPSRGADAFYAQDPPDRDREPTYHPDDDRDRERGHARAQSYNGHAHEHGHGHIDRVLNPLSPANPAAYGPSHSSHHGHGHDRDYEDRARSTQHHPNANAHNGTATLARAHSTATGLPPLRNPLPPPPRDLYEMSPYKTLLSLPNTTKLLTEGSRSLLLPAAAAQPVSLQRHGGADTKRSKSIRSLFRRGSKKEGNGAGGDQVHFVPVFVGGQGPQGTTPGQAAGTSAAPVSGSGTALGNGLGLNAPSARASGPPLSAYIPPPPSGIHNPPAPPPPDFNDHSPLYFTQELTSPYASFLNHSPHRVMYQNRTWPSATHLYEALKYFPQRPDLADALHAVERVEDVYPLSASFPQGAVRPDWSENENFIREMEKVIELKMQQHPDLRSLLLGTGARELVYVDPQDPFWGSGPEAEGGRFQGRNELGKVLGRVRARLGAGVV